MMTIRSAQKKKLLGLLFISPWIIGFIMFFLIPMLQTFYFSFNEITITNTGFLPESIGFENYKYAFTSDAEFPIKLYQSIASLLADVPLILVFSFLMSVILNKKFFGSNFMKLIFFLTVILSSGVFLSLQAQTGALNNGQLSQMISDSETASSLLKKLQIEQYLIEMGVTQQMVNILIAPMQKLFSILSKSGIQIFIFIAALKSIPASLYEACHIEGATSWETFWKITFPLLSPMMLVNVIYTVIDSFMTFGNGALDYIYRTIFYTMKFGYGSALAWIYFAIISIILAIVGRMISKKVFYYE